MGLTIQYSLVSQAERPEDARALVEQLRNRARDLPFAEVGEIVEFQSEPECRPSYFDSGDEHQCLSGWRCELLALWCLDSRGWRIVRLGGSEDRRLRWDHIRRCCE